MARSGQTYGINGQAILASEWHEGKVVSEHVIRIIPNPEKVRFGYLQAVLSHPELGQTANREPCIWHVGTRIGTRGHRSNFRFHA